jgi:hypothetical protein
VGRPARKSRCRWRLRHRKIIASKQFKQQSKSGGQVLDYFKSKPEAELAVTTPRQRHVVNLLYTARTDITTKACAIDLSQTYGMGGFQYDVLPCIATNARIFNPHWARCLQLPELFFLMGFPVGRLDFSEWPEVALCKALGNIMHVAVVGVVMMSMLILCRTENEAARS